MHRYHFLDDMLLCAAVDGTARLVQMEAGFQWVKRGAPKKKPAKWAPSPVIHEVVTHISRIIIYL